MELLDSKNLQFNQLRDKILSESNTNPIYASHFTDYYKEYFHHTPDKKLEFVVIHDETAVLLFLLHEYAANNTEARHYSYYGLPGVVAINSKVDSEIQDSAMRQILIHLREIGVLKNLRNNPFEITYPDLSSKKINSGKQMFLFHW